MKKGIMKAVEGLFQKADQTEARYIEAQERKQDEILQTQLELSEATTIHKDMHKMYLLNQVSEETYEVEKLKVEALQKKLVDLQRDMQIITEYQREDVLEVIAELEAEKAKGGKEYHAEMDQLKLDLMEAKLVYLQQMKQAKEKYDVLVSPTRKIDMLKIKLGMKKNSYISDSFDALNSFSFVNGGHESLIVTLPEVSNSLGYGRTPENLEKLIQGRKGKL
ncbi:hypothetical protein LG311_17830 [Sutcliffiella horikoshii]|uniref:hypothetical protein n=1 Tax=Sutcliffiella horikoshii TaxID=79883 RepID=UPI00384D07B8